ncbi:MAG: hypothetical protein HN790_05485 [Methylococcales bacterium]|jgi:hypothetical protein|nr:hypothetical protein [Methylococcales bacterium]
MKKRLVLVIGLMIGSTQANASGIPTIDVANILQTTTTSLESISQTVESKIQTVKETIIANESVAQTLKLVETVNNQVTQITEAKARLQQQFKQFESLTGSRGMSDLLNSQADKLKRRFTPGNWQDTLASLNTGNTADVPDSFKPFLTASQKNIDSLTALADLSDETMGIIKGEANSTSLGLASANATQQRVVQNVDAYESLNKAIEDTKDMKGATDMGNRLLVQNGLTTNELLQAVTLSNIQAYEQQQKELNEDIANRKASDFTVPDVPLGGAK